MEGITVNLISLSAYGAFPGSMPTADFLKEWKLTYDVPFTVAGSPGDSGKEFYEVPQFPNVVIIDQESKLAYKKRVAPIDEWFAKVKELAAP